MVNRYSKNLNGHNGNSNGYKINGHKAKTIDSYFTRGVVRRYAAKRPITEGYVVYNHKKKFVYSGIVAEIKDALIKSRTVASEVTFALLHKTLEDLMISSSKSETSDIVSALVNEGYVLMGHWEKYNDIDPSKPSMIPIHLSFSKSYVNKNGKRVYKITDSGLINNTLIDSYLNGNSKK